jgi:hypothetical protein
MVACTGSSLPTEADARTVFENEMGLPSSDGIVRITYFRKVNGQSGEKSGVKFYRLYYEAELEYPKGLHTMLVKYDKGEKIKRKGIIRFKMTEKGWKGSFY